MVVTTSADLVITEGGGNELPVPNVRIKMGANASALSKASEGSNKGPVALASVFELFRYATALDIFCLILGGIASGVTGAAQPAMMVRPFARSEVLCAHSFMT